MLKRLRKWFLSNLLLIFILSRLVNSINVQFFQFKNSTGLVYSSSSTASCNNIPENNENVFMYSIKTDVCIMVYAYPNCQSWSKKFDRDNSMDWQWHVKSYHICNDDIGGYTLNIDITQYYDIFNSPYDNPEVLEYYQNVCDCINIPQYIEEMPKWSLNNHGNNLIAYYESDCSRRIWPPKPIPAGHQSDSMNMASHQMYNEATKTVYKIQSLGPDPSSTYFKMSCEDSYNYNWIMQLELLETWQDVDAMQQEASPDENDQSMALAQRNENRVVFFQSTNFLGAHYESNISTSCMSLPRIQNENNVRGIQPEIQSIKTDFCVILFSDNQCMSRSIKVYPSGSTNLTRLWEITVTGKETLDLLYDMFPNWKWVTGSFYACNEAEGSSQQLIVDLTSYNPVDKEATANQPGPEIYGRYTNLCTCQNIPFNIQVLDKYSIENHGNPLMAYFEHDCMVTKFEPLWIPAGRSSYSIGFGSFTKNSNERNAVVQKIQSIGPDPNADYYQNNCANNANSNMDGGLAGNMNEQLQVGNGDVTIGVGGQSTSNTSPNMVGSINNQMILPPNTTIQISQQPPNTTVHISQQKPNANNQPPQNNGKVFKPPPNSNQMYPQVSRYNKVPSPKPPRGRPNPNKMTSQSQYNNKWKTNSANNGNQMLVQQSIKDDEQSMVQMSVIGNGGDMNMDPVGDSLLIQSQGNSIRVTGQQPGNNGNKISAQPNNANQMNMQQNGGNTVFMHSINGNKVYTHVVNGTKILTLSSNGNQIQTQASNININMSSEPSNTGIQMSVQPSNMGNQMMTQPTNQNQMGGQMSNGVITDTSPIKENLPPQIEMEGHKKKNGVSNWNAGMSKGGQMGRNFNNGPSTDSPPIEENAPPEIQIDSQKNDNGTTHTHNQLLTQPGQNSNSKSAQAQTTLQDKQTIMNPWNNGNQMMAQSNNGNQMGGQTSNGVMTESPPIEENAPPEIQIDDSKKNSVSNWNPGMGGMAGGNGAQMGNNINNGPSTDTSPIEENSPPEIQLDSQKKSNSFNSNRIMGRNLGGTGAQMGRNINNGPSTDTPPIEENSPPEIQIDSQKKSNNFNSNRLMGRNLGGNGAQMGNNINNGPSTDTPPIEENSPPEIQLDSQKKSNNFNSKNLMGRNWGGTGAQMGRNINNGPSTDTPPIEENSPPEIQIDDGATQTRNQLPMQQSQNSQNSMSSQTSFQDKQAIMNPSNNENQMYTQTMNENQMPSQSSNITINIPSDPSNTAIQMSVQPPNTGNQMSTQPYNGNQMMTQPNNINQMGRQMSNGAITETPPIEENAPPEMQINSLKKNGFSNSNRLMGRKMNNNRAQMNRNNNSKGPSTDTPPIEENSPPEIQIDDGGTHTHNQLPTQQSQNSQNLMSGQTSFQDKQEIMNPSTNNNQMLAQQNYNGNQLNTMSPQTSNINLNISSRPSNGGIEMYVQPTDMGNQMPMQQSYIINQMPVQPSNTGNQMPMQQPDTNGKQMVMQVSIQQDKGLGNSQNKFNQTRRRHPNRRNRMSMQRSTMSNKTKMSSSQIRNQMSPYPSRPRNQTQPQLSKPGNQMTMQVSVKDEKRSNSPPNQNNQMYQQPVNNLSVQQPNSGNQMVSQSNGKVVVQVQQSNQNEASQQVPKQNASALTDLPNKVSQIEQQVQQLKQNQDEDDEFQGIAAKIKESLQEVV